MQDGGIFIWSKEFETGLKDVDKEHHYLIDQLNVLSAKMIENDLSRSDMEDIFKKLLDYTVFHFGHEEEIMDSTNFDETYVKNHKRNHKIFVEEVSHMYADLSTHEGVNMAKATNLRDFLVNWLAFHILEEDKALSSQMKLLNEGLSSKEAYEKMLSKKDGKSRPLVNALKGIMEVLSLRNKELIELKNSLEKTVQERTAELVKANKTLEHLSLTDTLTGLENRRSAMRSLNELWKEKQKFGAEVSVLMIDADHFKEVNDTCGHDAGDVVLQAIATCISDSVRTDDIVCRLGGDEFLVICPETDLKGGVQVGKNIHAKINNLTVPTGEDKSYHGSVSIGVASSQNCANINELIKHADECVYMAKRDGKNCVRFKDF